MSQCCSLPCRSLPARVTKIVSRHRAPAARAVVCVAAPLHRIAALAALYHDTNAAPPPRYKTLYRDTHPQRPGHRARAVGPCARGDRVVACIMAYHVMSWACPGRIVATPLDVPARPCVPLRCLPALLVTIQLVL